MVDEAWIFIVQLVMGVASMLEKPGCGSTRAGPTLLGRKNKSGSFGV
jgi:hypothetical protein